jgi:hypothetical protein
VYFCPTFNFKTIVVMLLDAAKKSAKEGKTIRLK